MNRTAKVFFLMLLPAVIVVLMTRKNVFHKNRFCFNREASYTWTAPDINELPSDNVSDEIKYGRELIVHTAVYLGPRGKVKAMSNGMNCQNCHLESGTKYFGNNYSAVASTFPKFRARSGTIEDIEKRINDCFERSLNGKALSKNGREMRAMVSYMKWLGKGVPRDINPKGAGIIQLEFLDKAADPLEGKLIYDTKCIACHCESGEGILNKAKNEWIYPPLWGDNSYNDGAGLYRLSRFAGFIKSNMPLGASYDKPQLSDLEAWNVAAYVNTLPRPKKNTTYDWPDVSKKPVDYPFGPFGDTFNAQQHKLGPFKQIETRNSRTTDSGYR